MHVFLGVCEVLRLLLQSISYISSKRYWDRNNVCDSVDVYVISWVFLIFLSCNFPNLIYFESRTWSFPDFSVVKEVPLCSHSLREVAYTYHRSYGTSLGFNQEVAFLLHWHSKVRIFQYGICRWLPATNSIFDYSV